MGKIKLYCKIGVGFTGIPQNLKYLIKATLAVPKGSVSAERAFAIMNLIKTFQRSSLNLDVVDALMRIAMHHDTLDTFDFKKATIHYAKSHDLCD